MNIATFLGRLTRDPELRSTQSGTSVCSFSIAVPRAFKRDGQPDVDFFNIVAFGKRGEVISQYFKKGGQIAVSGRLQNDSYTDKNGNKRTSTQLILNEFDFVGSNGGGNKSADQSSGTQETLLDPDFETIDDSDVPF